MIAYSLVYFSSTNRHFRKVRSSQLNEGALLRSISQRQHQGLGLLSPCTASPPYARVCPHLIGPRALTTVRLCLVSICLGNFTWLHLSQQLSANDVTFLSPASLSSRTSFAHTTLHPTFLTDAPNLTSK